MVLEPSDGTRDAELVELVRDLAVAGAALALLLLALAVLTELLRRVRRAGRLVAALDRLLPRSVRAVATSIIAVTATVMPLRPVAAADSVRGWLGQATTTTSPAAVVTPDALDELVPSTPAPVGPMVLEPRDSGAPPVAPAPAPAPASAPTPPPAPPAESVYVVRPGDCLWAIAQARLDPTAGDVAIDAGWRAIYAQNRDAIGDNPSLIHPGLVLRLPPP